MIGQIQALASEGYGILRSPGEKVILVPYVLPQEKIHVHHTKKKKNHLIATSYSLIEASVHRQEAPCKDFGTCGGCRWQMAPYQLQLEFKRDFVRQAFAQENWAIPLPLASPHLWGYRHKVEYSFGYDAEGKPAIGFHPRENFAQVIAIGRCHIAAPFMEEIRRRVLSWFEAHPHLYLPYDPRTHTGILRSLMVRGDAQNWLAALVIAPTSVENYLPLLDALQTLPGMRGLFYVINPKHNDVYHDLEFHRVAGEDLLPIPFKENLTYYVSPGSFFQMNIAAAQQLFAYVSDWVPQGTSVVHDLYAGIGAIGLYVAPKCQKVVSVESYTPALRLLAYNRQMNASYVGQTQFEMHATAVEKIVAHLPPAELTIVDPPRAGLHPNVLHALCARPPKRLIYLSCNPATQARDWNVLKTRFTMEAVQPVDMFPHTHAIENVLVLTRA
ncbi:MAG: 23S rRNA (uracil(1939)-C(5))-methyltransferase RlmD [Bacteroidia bacterium]